MVAMSADDLLTILTALTDPRFSEPVALLTSALRAGGVTASVSPRLVPGAELRTIYVARRDRSLELGLRMSGLSAWVDVLFERPDEAWTLVAVAGAGVLGGVFVAVTGAAGACVARASDAE